MKTFFIPGLGYDCRIFEKLTLSIPDTECINWIEPKPNESLHEYSLRMLEQTGHTEDEIILIGHSLGGIVAQEIASTRNVTKVILISSIKARKEMPLFFKLAKPLFVDKLFTKEMSIRTIKYWGGNHGFETAEEKEFFKSMVGNQTNTYLQWALRGLSSWREPVIPQSTQLIRIHGTNDKTFPINRLDGVDLMIENGSHILVYKKAEQVSQFIAEQIVSSR